jgi:CHAT domain-containing protein/tetratricopeptide (TPR) repeat protein
MESSLGAIVAPSTRGRKMMTPRDIGEGPGEQVRELARCGDPDAARRLRELLFDVRRGALAVDGPNALALGQAGLTLRLWGEAEQWAGLALEGDLTPDQRSHAHAVAIAAPYQRGALADALRAVRAAGDPPRGAGADARLRLDVTAGEALAAMGRVDEALERYRRVDGLSSDPGLRAWLECASGSALNALGRNEEAVAAYERALALEADAPPAILLNLGNALRELERYDEAERRYGEARAGARGDPVVEGTVLSNHARLLLARGRARDAKAMLKDAFALRQAHDPAGAAISAEELAKVCADESDYATAAHWAAVALNLRRSTGQPDDEWLTEFAASMAGNVRAMESQPGVAGHNLVDQLRAVPPGEWSVVLDGATEAMVEAAATRLSNELAAGGAEPEGRRVEDRWMVALLKRWLTVGPQLALAEESERLRDVGRTVDAVLDVLAAKHWIQRKRRYEARRGLLEQELGSEVLRMMKGRAEEVDVGEGEVDALLQLVKACKVRGVDVAFAELPEAHRGELVNRLTMVGTWRETLRLVQAHREQLLGDETIALLERARDASSPSERARVAQHIDVLRRARVVGPDRAFAEAPAADGRPLGLKGAGVGLGPASDDDVAAAQGIRAAVADAGDPELLRLAELALDQAELARAVAVLHDERSGPADLDRAARAFERSGQLEFASDALARLGHAQLRRHEGDRAAHLRAAVDTFKRAHSANLAFGESESAELRLGAGTAMWELWRLGGQPASLLLDAGKAFEEALRATPVERAPRRAREAARGLHDTSSAYLATSPRRSDAVNVRQVKVRACRTAMAATDELLRTGGADDPTAEMAGTLWAYQGAVDELCALGFYAAALAAAEQGRARGFLAEIERRPGASTDVRLRQGAPPTAEELSAFAAAQEPGVVVLAWYATATDCHAFILHGGSRDVRGFATGVGATRLEELARLAADSLWKRPARPDEPLSPAWYQLMDTLVPPAWRELVAAAQEIVLVPHGAVGELPLHALPIRWMGGRTLLDAARVEYLPGLALANRLRGRVTAGDVALVMAHAGERGNGAQESEFEREARVVAETVGGEHLYVGPRAHADRLTELGSRASIVHIAAHGVFEADDALGSGLFLSDGTEHGSERLSAREVLRLPELPGSVIVLSGCETSRRSADLTGEGHGLVRAFLLAGARAVVASQWRVDSPSTRSLMERFHAELRKTGDVAGSLRTAALSLRDSPATSHPYYWAPFVAVGV